MRKLRTAACVVGTFGLLATPALAFGPATGDHQRAQHQPGGAPQYNGTENPGTDRRQAARPESIPSPRSGRALGVVCQGESKSNENDPEPGTPFSRCVKALAQANRKACAGEPKQRPEGDTARGTPFSRCVSALAKGLRSSKAKSNRGQAKSACRRPDFESGREFSRCVQVLAKALRTL